MNCIELVVFGSVVPGAALGATLGAQRSVPLAIVGLVAGAPLAFLGVLGALAALGLTLGALERRARRRALHPTFGAYWKRSRAAAWREATSRLRPGTRVRGRVVLVDGSQLFLDVGVGFPAWIFDFELRGRFDSATPIKHHVGDEVDAVVTIPDRRERHELLLEETEPDWIRFEGALVGHTHSSEDFTRGGQLSYRAHANDAHAAFEARLESAGSARIELIHGLEVRTVEVRRPSRATLEIVGAAPATPPGSQPPSNSVRS